jgi:hypothetical protein
MGRQLLAGHVALWNSGRPAQHYPKSQNTVAREPISPPPAHQVACTEVLGREWKRRCTNLRTTGSKGRSIKYQYAKPAANDAIAITQKPIQADSAKPIDRNKRTTKD